MIEGMEDEPSPTRAELMEAVAAAKRLLANVYMDWNIAGGPNQCRHGYADGIPCPDCDRRRVNEIEL